MWIVEHFQLEYLLIKSVDDIGEDNLFCWQIEDNLFCWQIEEKYLLAKPFQLKQLLLLGSLLLVTLCLVLHL